MPVKISIETIGPSAREFGIELDKMTKDIRDDLISLGKKARDVMRNTIDVKRKRPKSTDNNLAKHIETGYLDLPGGDVIVWVGDITDLDKYAPYWYLINYGGKIKSGPVPGRFADGPPMAGGGGQGFKYLPTNATGLMNPMKPIEPKNYIEKAMLHVVSGLAKISRRK